MTRIFFMVRTEYGKRDRDSCSPANAAFHPHLSAVQFRAGFHQQQPQSGAGSYANISTAMKRFEQLLLILFRNSNALIANDAHSVAAIALDRQAYFRARLGILH